MLKRALLILSAIVLGYGLAQFATRSGAPSWWPDGDRDRNVRYFREVIQVVKEKHGWWGCGHVTCFNSCSKAQTEKVCSTT